MKLQGLSAGAAVAFTLLTSSSAFAVTEISWWHAMTGANNEVVETLSKEFNESQSDYKVVPVFKGTYPETLNAGIAAYRAGQAPHIIQIFDAGTGTMTPFLDLEPEKVREVLDVDLLGPFLCSQKAARHMIRQGDGGRIVNVTSVHEHQPRVGAAPYCAAKGGLGLLTQVMALELAEHGITVNAVAPGEIATPMTGQEDTDPHTESRPGIPLGRPGDAREVAAVIAFLAGPDASYVTGASWSVDGGMLRMGPQAGSHLTSHEWRRP